MTLEKDEHWLPHDDKEGDWLRPPALPEGFEADPIDLTFLDVIFSMVKSALVANRKKAERLSDSERVQAIADLISLCLIAAKEDDQFPATCKQ